MSDRIRASCFPVRRNIETTRSAKVAAEIRAGRSQRDAQSAPRLSPLWFESRLWVLHGGGIDPFFGWFLVQSSIGTLHQLCTVKAHVMQLAKKQIVQSKKGDWWWLPKPLWSFMKPQYVSVRRMFEIDHHVPPSLQSHPITLLDKILYQLIG